jgi:hypothetical protein
LLWCWLGNRWPEASGPVIGLPPTKFRSATPIFYDGPPCPALNVEPHRGEGGAGVPGFQSSSNSHRKQCAAGIVFWVTAALDKANPGVSSSPAIAAGSGDYSL